MPNLRSHVILIFFALEKINNIYHFSGWNLMEPDPNLSLSKNFFSHPAISPLVTRYAKHSKHYLENIRLFPKDVDILASTASVFATNI